jgi:O-methyltransferase involved in polyketide biosynthesis
MTALPEDDRPPVPFRPTPTPATAAPRVDPPTASTARVHDVQLGGSLNFAADRELALALDEAAPGLAAVARAGRRFVHDAVERAARAGVDQFLDLGCGVSAGHGIHHTARAIEPYSRVAYVDSDLVAVAHARIATAGDTRLSVVEGDIRDVTTILGDIEAAGHLDLSRPVAVIAASVLHFVPGSIVPVLSALRSGTAGGSLLVLSHLARYPRAAEARDDEYEVVQRLYARTRTPVLARSPSRISAGIARSGWRALAPGWHAPSARTPGGLGLATALAQH